MIIKSELLHFFCVSQKYVYCFACLMLRSYHREREVIKLHKMKPLKVLDFCSPESKQKNCIFIQFFATQVHLISSESANISQVNKPQKNAIKSNVTRFWLLVPVTMIRVSWL